MTGLYLHIPFCLRKCPYCDFFSVPHRGVAVSDYVQAVIEDLRQAADRWSGPVSTLFFGGGTPSLLAPSEVALILAEVDRLYGLASDIEISLEANPGTLDLEKLRGYRAAGVNRLSIGLQSLDDNRLKLLGRLHDVATGLQAVQDARAAGFDNISCDLMFAVPGQSPADLLADLDRLLALEPEHVAVYGLTIEAGTPFADRQVRNELTLPDEEDYVAAYRLLHERLNAAGYDHYEISNFARPGKRCRHNQRYWQRLSVLGVGAGAHSFRDDAWGSRSAVPNDLDGYQVDLLGGRDPAREIESFDRQGAMIETLYLGLRTLEGVDDDDFAARFGCRVDEAFAQAVERCRPHLQKRDGRWSFDLDGWLLFDSLILNFF
jgi:oxygen-independent coproporphyrinogen-3 oxidase